MREDVDRPRLETFLQELGRSFRRRARLYLTGGESLVWRGLRGSTRDIDGAWEVAPEHLEEWVRVLRDLKERLAVNVEESEPAHFVPLPPGARERAESVGRYGDVEVFLFDPYSVALSKLARGHARDLADVRALVGAGTLRPDRFRELVLAALTRAGACTLRFDPMRVERNLGTVLGDG